MTTDSLPGLESPAIAELTVAVQSLQVIRKQRMALTKQEVEAAEKVLALMHEHGITVYSDTNFDPPVRCEIVPGRERVRVKIKDEDEESEED